MNKSLFIPLAILALGSAGCIDDDDRDVTPPAAPRSVFSVTGDRIATIYWIDNTEPDLAGYNVYVSGCADGPDCPYRRIGTTNGTDFVASGLVNGDTYFFAVAAYDRAGNESKLSYDTVFDTPRPAGSNARLEDFMEDPAGPAGWDLSAARAVRYDDPSCDIFFGENGSVAQMFAADTWTDIQDAGWHPTMDGVDFAPIDGWSPTGTVELIVGHVYVVWTRDDHYAKFRVNQLTPSSVTYDWAYQSAGGNRELGARRVRAEELARRPVTWLR
jgi:hypothetical protein